MSESNRRTPLAWIVVRTLLLLVFGFTVGWVVQNDAHLTTFQQDVGGHRTAGLMLIWTPEEK